MNRNRYLIVFDFETDGKSPQNCNVTQVAAVPVDLRNLEILEDNFFKMDVCPQAMEEEDYFESHEDTINWHAQQMGVSAKEVVSRWEKGVPEKEAWLEFNRYIKDYCKGGKWDQKPIPGGQNIRGYDLPICERYAQKYSKGLDFNKRDIFDLMDFTRAWFMFTPDAPSSLSMDALRDFFGISKVGAHDAIKDVNDTAYFITKFLALHERVAPRVNWQGNS